MSAHKLQFITRGDDCFLQHPNGREEQVIPSDVNELYGPVITIGNISNASKPDLIHEIVEECNTTGKMLMADVFYNVLGYSISLGILRTRARGF